VALAWSTVYGRGVDWPVTYDDLKPFYSQGEEDEVGVSGDSNETLGSPRSTGYPMPTIPQTFMDKAYARALVAPNSRFARRLKRATRPLATKGLRAAGVPVASQSARSRRNMTRPHTCHWQRRAARLSMRKQRL
jgi:choline dehydrogenase-like flavoprotein